MKTITIIVQMVASQAVETLDPVNQMIILIRRRIEHGTKMPDI
ncbi:hypothetical protein [Methanomethylovorans sp.]